MRYKESDIIPELKKIQEEKGIEKNILSLFNGISREGKNRILKRLLENEGKIPKSVLNLLQPTYGNITEILSQNPYESSNDIVQVKQLLYTALHYKLPGHKVFASVLQKKDEVSSNNRKKGHLQKQRDLIFTRAGKLHVSLEDNGEANKNGNLEKGWYITIKTLIEYDIFQHVKIVHPDQRKNLHENFGETGKEIVIYLYKVPIDILENNLQACLQKLSQRLHKENIKPGSLPYTQTVKIEKMQGDIESTYRKLLDSTGEKEIQEFLKNYPEQNKKIKKLLKEVEGENNFFANKALDAFISWRDDSYGYLRRDITNLLKSITLKLDGGQKKRPENIQHTEGTKVFLIDFCNLDGEPTVLYDNPVVREGAQEEGGSSCCSIL